MIRRFLAAGLMAGLLSAPPALAHSSMIQANIEENAHIAEAPAEFALTFEHEAAITSFMVMKSNDEMIAVDFKPSGTMSRNFQIPLPALTAGEYVLSWKSMTKDGHVMPGSIHFTVTGQ